MDWISIEERKPPNAIYVLVAVFDARPKVNMHFICIAEKINENWFEGKDGHCITGKCRTITHWMPLPDKPK